MIHLNLSDGGSASVFPGAIAMLRQENDGTIVELASGTRLKVAESVKSIAAMINPVNRAYIIDYGSPFDSHETHFHVAAMDEALRKHKQLEREGRFGNYT